jgi:indolepyruvate ferredoxin oxidoreductase beta subunit
MSHDSRPINLIITGVGGQGNVLAARLLAAVALEEGYEVTVGDVYGLSQRGGSVASHVRWTKSDPLPPLVPHHSLDVLLGLEPLEALRVLTRFGNESTMALVNVAPIMPIGVQAGRFAYPDLSTLQEGLRKLTKALSLVDAEAIAQELGDQQVQNMVMLGALFGSGFIELRFDLLEKAARSVSPERHLEVNLWACRRGRDLVGSKNDPG